MEVLSRGVGRPPQGSRSVDQEIVVPKSRGVGSHGFDSRRLLITLRVQYEDYSRIAHYILAF